MAVVFIYLFLGTRIGDRLAQWPEYSPIAQEVAGSIPAWCKHMVTLFYIVCMNISVCIGSGRFLCKVMYVFTTKKSK
jgi:hypothetical protein